MQVKAVSTPALDGNVSENMRALLEYMIQMQKQVNYVLKNIGTDNMETSVATVVQQAVDNSEGINASVSENTFKSYIQQTAKTIRLKVSNDKVIAAINLSPEEASIEAAKINLTGYTSINENFSVDEGGKFHANAGSVAGWTFDKDSGFYYGSNDATISPSLYFGPFDLKKAVAIAGSAERTDWRLKIGAAAGFTNTGALYCQDGYFRGNVDAGKISYGTGNTVSGDAITVYTIVNSRVASHTLDESSIESAYANLKSNVSTMLQYYTGGLRAGSFYCSYIDATGTINYRGNSLSLLTATISGTTIHYVGW